METNWLSWDRGKGGRGSQTEVQQEGAVVMKEFCDLLHESIDAPVAQEVKKPPTMQETQETQI